MTATLTVAPRQISLYPSLMIPIAPESQITTTDVKFPPPGAQEIVKCPG